MWVILDNVAILASIPATGQRRGPFLYPFSPQMHPSTNPFALDIPYPIFCRRCLKANRQRVKKTSIGSSNINCKWTLGLEDLSICYPEVV
ncbi:hypothetical protein TNCV_2982291 [Trichonephila clavipes]|nr:hypothetical protein TNCV_2982291 [Trichonephila clavipes]